MGKYLFNILARILAFCSLFVTNNILFPLEKTPLFNVNLLTISSDSIWPNFSKLWPQIHINICGETIASNAIHNMENYVSNHAWPAIRSGSRDLVAEVAGEVIRQGKILLIAAAGLSLSIAGGQIIRHAFTTNRKRSESDSNLENEKTRKKRLVIIGTSMVVAGLAAILFCNIFSGQSAPASA